MQSSSQAPSPLPQSRLNNFDLLRLLAVGQVMANHINEFLKLPIGPNLAYCIELFPGVAVFFVISGFLVAKSYVESDSSLRKFFAKRALRIYPALFLSIFLTNVLLYCTGAFHLADIVTWPFIRHHLVQLPTASWWYAGWYFNGYPYAFPAYNGGQYPNLVLWSLTVEINFYLFLPAIIGRLWNRTVSGATGYSLLVWGAISIVFAIWMSWLAQTAPNSDARAILINMVFPHLWIFLTGVAAYLYWHILGRLIVGKFLFWIAAYSALSYYNYRAHGIGILDFDLFSPMIFARVVLLAGCVLSFAYTCPRLSQVLKGNDISYGMYLNHFLIVWVFGDLGITGRAWLWWAVGGLSVLVGYASWRFVERPMLGLKSRFR